ncbi:helix-turn-helix domain-containing protein [Evansella cellulosilytica]|uniref:Helix-turn-helix domain protein n=1 Tax=Evansella cellulosilytica (strain ATCC 21833 / DSM 2522 / FERM P-1141 / JCM 9156 / N-4) TaxID=649639 RepID=E6TUS8_EVAC2|nr:helix-turn-helix transcriptional regulator [Evansella cellulosilytica]ADU32080.1 helix-turn-helix domain protein [Evansella cellulosilytica DSM 2522]
MRREWLIKLRKSKGLTQEQVASAAFIDRAFFSQVETGKRNPGFDVAANIANVLDFDPMIFFQEHLKEIPSSLSLPNDNIHHNLQSISNGEILYLYKEIGKYIQNLHTFVETGIDQGTYVFIFDTNKNNTEVLKRISAQNRLKYIYTINKDEINNTPPHKLYDNIINKLYDLNTAKTIRVWINKETTGRTDWFDKLDSLYKLMQKKIDGKNFLFSCSYEASHISADRYINMMRVYSLLMTDNEIVVSPLYKQGNHKFILPSLFIE